MSKKNVSDVKNYTDSKPVDLEQSNRNIPHDPHRLTSIKIDRFVGAHETRRRVAEQTTNDFLSQMQKSDTKSTMQSILRIIDLQPMERAILVDRFGRRLIQIEKKMKSLGFFHNFGHTVIQIGTLTMPALMTLAGTMQYGTVSYWCAFGTSFVTGVATSLINLFSTTKRYYKHKTLFQGVISEIVQFSALTGSYSIDVEELAGQSPHSESFPLLVRKIEKMFNASLKDDRKNANSKFGEKLFAQDDTSIQMKSIQNSSSY